MSDDKVEQIDLSWMDIIKYKLGIVDKSGENDRMYKIVIKEGNGEDSKQKLKQKVKYISVEAQYTEFHQVNAIAVYVRDYTSQINA